MPLPPFETHDVDNQPPEFAPRDLWADDVALREAVAARRRRRIRRRASRRYGALAGDELYRLSFDAHRDRPRLRTHDRFGQRIDRVEFHPNYHALMQAAIEHGVAGLSWREPQPGAHVARAALSYLHHQVEPGTSCPLTMTHAAVPVLRREPALARMGRQGRGSALRPARRADRRQARRHPRHGHDREAGRQRRARQHHRRDAAARRDGEYALVGHKWFFSAPMSDGFLVLAQAPGGLTCFLLPRRLPDGANATRSG